MNAPKLTRRLVLEAPVETADGGGGLSIVWTPLGTHWAEIRAASARETAGGGRRDARVTHRVTIRSAAIASPQRPSAEQRFRLGSRIFAIRGVADEDMRGRFLTCWVEEGALS